LLSVLSSMAAPRRCRSGVAWVDFTTYELDHGRGIAPAKWLRASRQEKLAEANVATSIPHRRGCDALESLAAT
jgi:hypothetical protein